MIATGVSTAGAWATAKEQASGEEPRHEALLFGAAFALSDQGSRSAVACVAGMADGSPHSRLPATKHEMLIQLRIIGPPLAAVAAGLALGDLEATIRRTGPLA